MWRENGPRRHHHRSKPAHTYIHQQTYTHTHTHTLTEHIRKFGRLLARGPSLVPRLPYHPNRNSYFLGVLSQPRSSSLNSLSLLCVCTFVSLYLFLCLFVSFCIIDVVLCLAMSFCVLFFSLLCVCVCVCVRVYVICVMCESLCLVPSLVRVHVCVMCEPLGLVRPEGFRTHLNSIHTHTTTHGERICYQSTHTQQKIDLLVSTPVDRW